MLAQACSGPHPTRPYGLTTDADRLLAEFVPLTQAADLIVVDLGETSRVEEYAGEMPPAAARAARARALLQVDHLLGRMLNCTPKDRWGVLVITPTMRSVERAEQLAALTPVLLRRPGEGTGLLWSASTRRPGVVVNTDIPATILDYFGLARPPLMVGRPLRTSPLRGRRLRHHPDESAAGNRLGSPRAATSFASFPCWLPSGCGRPLCCCSWALASRPGGRGFSRRLAVGDHVRAGPGRGRWRGGPSGLRHGAGHRGWRPPPRAESGRSSPAGERDTCCPPWLPPCS